MKCKVCGSESGKYPLCRACNIKKEQGLIIKCAKCGNWHYNSGICPTFVNSPTNSSNKYLYDVKSTLITKSEQSFYNAIKSSIPEGYYVFPQINLASFIERTDNSPFHNELFRNIDFLITDPEYRPKLIIEINDQTHLTPDRKERDEKVRKICEEAGIPILKLWTSWGVNPEYIKGKISETLEKLPVERVHHFNNQTPSSPTSPAPVKSPPIVHRPLRSLEPQQQYSPPQKDGGCYIATCVYGSYDCPQVWLLRRYRDNIMAKTWYGKAFIKIYYSVSPTLVRLFGNTIWFRKIFKSKLDNIINLLKGKGFEDTPYND